MNSFSPACMRRFVGTVAAVSLSIVAPAVRAEETTPPPPVPDTAAAFIAGTAVLVAGVGVGATIIAGNDGKTSDIGGWMVMQSGFAVAPLVAHGITGEWGRGLVFGSVPLATTAGTATVFALDSNAVRHSDLPQQRILWSLFVVGLFSSAYGVVDSIGADDRARRLVVAPVVGRGIAGIDVEGAL